jgi:ribosomal protein L7/L12
VGYGCGRATSPSAPPAPPDLDALEAVRPILAQDGKIAAIKAYRERTGVGLRDAKLAIERLGC